MTADTSEKSFETLTLHMPGADGLVVLWEPPKQLNSGRLRKKFPGRELLLLFLFGKC